MARHFSIRLVHFARPSCNEKPIVFGFFGRLIGFLVTNSAKFQPLQVCFPVVPEQLILCKLYSSSVVFGADRVSSTGGFL